MWQALSSELGDPRPSPQRGVSHGVKSNKKAAAAAITPRTAMGRAGCQTGAQEAHALLSCTSAVPLGASHATSLCFKFLISKQGENNVYLIAW